MIFDALEMLFFVSASAGFFVLLFLWLRWEFENAPVMEDETPAAPEVITVGDIWLDCQRRGYVDVFGDKRWYQFWNETNGRPVALTPAEKQDVDAYVTLRLRKHGLDSFGSLWNPEGEECQI